MQCILSLVFFLSSLFYLVTSISKENVNVFTQLVTELEDKESELQMTTKLTRIIKESNEINNQEPYPDEVIYETESEEVSSQSASAPYNMSTEKYERIINQLAKYRSFAINEIKVFLDDIDTYESSSKDNEIIRVYYKDDLQLECNIPESKFRGSYDWSINGYYLRLNESSYSLILDKKIDKNLTHLNFSCYFESTEAGQIVSLQFPTLVIDDYHFKGMSYNEYIFFKYKRQLKLLNISIVLILFFGVVTVALAWIYRSIKKKKANQNYSDYHLASGVE